MIASLRILSGGSCKVQSQVVPFEPSLLSSRVVECVVYVERVKVLDSNGICARVRKEQTNGIRDSD